MPTVVIIGGGPAGLSAAIYAVRANLDVTVLYTDCLLYTSRCV